MNKGLYTVNSNDPKAHKILRGLRCYVSSFINHQHRAKPGINTRWRIGIIVDALSPLGKNVALLSYYKARHSAVVFCDRYNNYGFASAYGNRVLYNFNLPKSTILEKIMNEVISWQDELTDSSVVYIANMNASKMKHYIERYGPINKFNVFTNNCSRFSANVLLAGCDATPGQFLHDRTWQMPANTLELAKEINLFLQSQPFNYG